MNLTLRTGMVPRWLTSTRFHVVWKFLSQKHTGSKYSVNHMVKIKHIYVLGICVKISQVQLEQGKWVNLFVK